MNFLVSTILFAIVIVIIITIVLILVKRKTNDEFLPGNHNYNYVTDWQQFDIINSYLVDDTGATFPTVIGPTDQNTINQS